MSHPLISDMLREYSCSNEQQAVNALREIMQNVALLALSRQDFFSRAAFYGGTCLRMFYGLNRFSEDLDFALLEKDESFRLDDYYAHLNKEFESYGLDIEIETRKKHEDTMN